MAMTSQPPFTVRVLDGTKGQAALEIGAPPGGDNITAMLPATYRTKADHIAVPDATTDFLESELLVKRLNAIQDWLWVCGRPMPPRPLHHQEVLSRELTITENMELHLVWSSRKSRLFLKPLPPYLLSADFWTSHLLPDANLDIPSSRQREDLAACALGFLHSYTALTAYESDFRIACGKGLLPAGVTWESWKAFTAEFLENACYASMNPRFWYGELRLSRLNKVYRFRMGYLFRGYSKVAAHTLYIDLLRDNFAALAGILGYVVIVLTAMQVGLSTEYLAGDRTFQGASWVVTLFSIIAPLVAGVVIVVIVLAMFVGNWAATKAYEQRRFREMGVERVWVRKRGNMGAVSDGREKLMGSTLDSTGIGKA